MITFANSEQLTITYNAQAEQVLLQKGYDSMSLYDKNSLVVLIANKEGKPYSEISSEHILSYHKNLKIDMLSQICENTIVSGLTASNGHTYQLNRDDQVNMIGQKDQLMADPSISSVLWKTEDVGYIEHTREEWLTVYSEAFSFKKAQLLKYNTLKGQVLVTETHEEIMSINWE